MSINTAILSQLKSGQKTDPTVGLNVTLTYKNVQLDVWVRLAICASYRNFYYISEFKIKNLMNHFSRMLVAKIMSARACTLAHKG